MLEFIVLVTVSFFGVVLVTSFRVGWIHREMQRLREDVSWLRSHLAAAVRPESAVAADALRKPREEAPPVTPLFAELPAQPVAHAAVAAAPESVVPAPRIAVREVSPPAAGPIPAGGAIARPAPRVRRHDEAGLESAIGQRWLVRVGALVLIVGVALLYVHAVQQGWVSETQRTISGAIGGILVFGLGIRFNRRGYAALAQGFVGCGSSLLLLDAFVAHRVYDIVNAPLAFFAMTAVTTATVIVAYRWSAMPLLLLAQIGAYLTPIVVSDLQADPNLALLDLFVVNAGVLIAAGLKRWTTPKAVAAIVTGIFIVVIDGSSRTMGSIPLPAWMIGFDVLFLCGLGLPHLLRGERTSRLFRAAVSTAAAAVALVGWAHLGADHAVMLGGMLVIVAGIHAAFAEWAERRCAADSAGREVVRACAAGLLLAAAACPFGMIGTTQAIALTALALIAAARTRDSIAWRSASAVGFALASGRVIAFHLHGDGPAVDIRAFLNSDFAAAAAVVVYLVAAAMIGDRRLRWMGLTAAGVLGGIVVSGELTLLVTSGVVDPLRRTTLGLVARSTSIAGIAVGFANAARESRRTTLLVLSFLHATLATLGFLLLLDRLQAPSQLFLLNPACLGALAVPFGLIGMSVLLRRAAIPMAATSSRLVGGLGLFLPLVALSVEAWRYFEMRAAPGPSTVSAGSAAISVTWTAYAAGLLALGIFLRHSKLRLSALLLLAVTSTKVVLSDLSHLDRLARIISFIALGLVLMTGAWAYHRFAPRIFPPPAPPPGSARNPAAPV